MSEPTPITTKARIQHKLRDERSHKAEMRGSHLESDDPPLPDGWDTAEAIERAGAKLADVVAAYRQYSLTTSTNRRDCPECGRETRASGGLCIVCISEMDERATEAWEGLKLP